MAPPRVPLAHLPTPIETLPRLTEAAGGATIMVKRDDCTGLAMGGNKARQLEFYFGDALDQGADTVLITGAVQSNYVRMAAAAAAKLGLVCHVQLEERVSQTGAAYQQSGNVLLDQLLGAHIHRLPVSGDDNAPDVELDRLADQLCKAGRRPYVIHLGLSHPPIGALGYVQAARELLAQQAAQDLQIDEIVVASGSGHTHAGLLYGLRSEGSEIPVVGVCVRREKDLQRPRIADHVRGLDTLTNQSNIVTSDDIVLTDGVLAPGYGLSNTHSEDAMIKAARLEGLLVDPVYTAKSLAAALDRAACLGAGKSLMFVHTGGTPGLFAYQPAITELIDDNPPS